MLTAQIRGAKSLVSTLKADRKRERRALFTAMRVAGYKLRPMMQREIRAGAPGGEPFAPLSVIAGRRRKPLRRLAIPVRYWVRRNPDEVHVGISGPAISKKWKWLAIAHQEGFERDPGAITSTGETLRQRFARRGGAMGKRSRLRKYFFLKKSTRRLKTPARPIIGPFWDAHGDEAWRMVRDGYRRKLRGERI